MRSNSKFAKPILSIVGAIALDTADSVEETRPMALSFYARWEQAFVPSQTVDRPATISRPRNSISGIAQD